MSLPQEAGESDLGSVTARYSLGWLTAANAVGVLLAVLLLHPDAGRFLGGFSYGKWIPLHLNFQLYGWNALPLVGLLFNRFLPDSPEANRQISRLFRCWSLVLLAGGLSWLMGESSGKIFLEWSGWPRLLLLGLLASLWFVLLAHRMRGKKKFAWPDDVLLLALASVPPALFWASRPGVYPAINPASGGPTGVSLLGSSLGVLLVFGIVPRSLNLPRLCTNRTRWLGLLWSAHFLFFLVLEFTGHSRRYDVAALGTLLIWIPLVPAYTGSFAWTAVGKIWKHSFFFWWTALVATGCLLFIPDFLQRAKFSNLLVAHSHLAMAGMLTSSGMLILVHLRGQVVAAVLAARREFWLWQGGLLLQLLSLTTLGLLEGRAAFSFFHHGSIFQILLGLRLAGGLAMLFASLVWFLRLNPPNICKDSVL